MASPSQIKPSLYLARHCAAPGGGFDDWDAFSPARTTTEHPFGMAVGSPFGMKRGRIREALDRFGKMLAGAGGIEPPNGGIKNPLPTLPDLQKKRSTFPPTFFVG